MYTILYMYILYMSHIYMYYFCKIKPVIPKGNQPWMFTERTDAEAEVPTLWPPDVKNQLPGKDPDAGKHWRQEEKGTTEDEMAEWHHQFNRYEFQQTGRWWTTWKPGVLQSVGSQRVRHDLATEQNHHNWITLWCTWNPASQLCFNKAYILRIKEYVNLILCD